MFTKSRVALNGTRFVSPSGHYNDAAVPWREIRGCELSPVKPRLIVFLTLFLVPSLFAQYGTTGTTSMNGTNGMSVFLAPTWSGETGLFTTVSANTLRRG